MTTKIAVSLPDELVEAARAAVRDGRAASVSAYVADALREKSGRYTLADVLDRLDAELGPPGPEADAWAKREANRVLGDG
jgi:Arc/MetJ-type ribon-helix-helix transcriptional regulator